MLVALVVWTKQGVVLQCYGAGNMPSNRQDIIDALGRDSQNLFLE
jgi:hypothetical protein